MCCVWIGVPLAIHKIRIHYMFKFCVHWCRYFVLILCTVLCAVLCCMYFRLNVECEREREKASGIRVLCWSFQLLRPTTNHKATRISIDVAISNCCSLLLFARYYTRIVCRTRHWDSLMYASILSLDVVIVIVVYIASNAFQYRHVSEFSQL